MGKQELTQDEVMLAADHCKDEDGIVTFKQIMNHLGLNKDKHSKLCLHVSKLTRAGHLKRIRLSTYRVVSKPNAIKPNGKMKIWKVIRARRQVDYDTLVELTGLERAYIQHYMHRLIKHGYVKKTGRFKSGVYKLVKDQIDYPAVNYDGGKS